MDTVEMCLVCYFKPDLICNQCKKAYCGDCWKYKKVKCHNSTYRPLSDWDWAKHKTYAR